MARRDITGAVDFAHLERFAGGDATVIEEVLGMFPEQASLWARLLNPEAPDENWRNGAHALKGAALGIGAVRLAEACAAAEADSEAGLGRKTTHVARIQTALDAAMADIAAYVHERALQSLRTPRA